MKERFSFVQVTVTDIEKKQNKQVGCTKPTRFIVIDKDN